MKLINADALSELVGEPIEVFLSRLDLKLPQTIEAEPVRYGKWIKADSQQYFRKHYPCFTCSECGYRKDSQKKWNYCPNCGAYMRGESE